MASPEVAVGGALAGVFFLIIILWLMFIGIAVLAFIFWIFMIIDVAKRQFKNDNDKIVWILVIVLAGIIGTIIYYFVVKRPDKH